MKKLKYLLIAILFAAFAGEGFGQNDFITENQLPSYPNYGNNEANGVKYISTVGQEGYVSVFNLKQHLVVTKTDLNGITVWSKSISGLDGEYIYTGALYGEFPVLLEIDNIDGSVYLAYNKDSQCFVSKLNPNGNIIYTVGINEQPQGTPPQSVEPMKMKKVTSQGQSFIAILTNTHGSPSPSLSMTTISTMSTSGAPHFSKNYDIEARPAVDLWNNSASFIQNSNTGELIIIAANWSNIQYLSINAFNGNVISPISLFILQPYSNVGITEIIEINPSPGISAGFLISGYNRINYYPTGFRLRNMIIKLNTNFNIQWINTFDIGSAPNTSLVTTSIISKGSEIHAVIGDLIPGTYGGLWSFIYQIRGKYMASLTINNTGIVTGTTTEISGTAFPYIFDYGHDGYPVLSEVNSTAVHYFNSYNCSDNFTSCSKPTSNIVNINNEGYVFGNPVTSSTTLQYYSPKNPILQNEPISSSTFCSNSTSVCTQSYTTTNVSCSIGNDGVITVITDPNCSPYTFQWSSNAGGATTPSVSNLSTGTYSVTVSDACGIPTILNINLGYAIPELSNLIITNNVCENDCNGTISFSTTPTGIGGIQGYVWDNGLGSGTGAPIPVSGLCNGTYTVTITENGGCTLIEQFTIVATELITYSTSGQDVTCSGACNGFASVSANSSTSLTYLWNNGATTPSVNNLCPGTYSITITSSSGCTKTHSFVIGTNPTLNTNWQKNTDNQTGANDVVKRTLTDAQGNLYVMGEFINQTAIDGYLINNGGINNQKAIFIAKYRPCGDLEWVINSQNFSSYYDIEGFDIDFTQNQQDITLFAKWNNTSPALPEYSFVSSNGSSNTFTNQGANRDVFSISFDVGTGSVTTISKNYLLDYADRLTTGKVTGSTSYIGGQIAGQAIVKWYNISGPSATPIITLSEIIKDLNFGNIVADFEVDGTNGYIIAAINLETSSAVLDPNNPVSISTQGDAIMVIAPQQNGPTLSPTFINPAYGSDVTIHDVDMNLTTLGNRVTAVGEFKGQLPGWQTGGISINSNIKTALIAQFQANNLSNTATYQMDGQIQSASAAAVITNPDAITVTGLMNGLQAQINTNTGVIGTTTNIGAGANTMWVARFLYNNASGDWMISTDGVQDVIVNDISYHYQTGLFYTGGQYMDDISMPPLSNLNFPYPGTGQKLGFIIRGGDQYTPGQGAFYKTAANEQPKENLVDAESGFKIYPNPNNGQFNLEINTEMDEEVYLTIYTVTGQMVFQKIVSSPSKEMNITFQPDGLSSGFYTIQLQQGNQILFQKMIVE